MSVQCGDEHLIKLCREQGFMTLDWEEKILDPISGQLIDRAELKGNNFVISIVIGYRGYPLKTELKGKYNSNEDYSVTVMFEYYTALGRLPYLLTHRERNIEKAREYAQWQATLLFKLLNSTRLPEQIV